MNAATAFRVGASCAGLLVTRTPSLARLALSGSVGRGDAGRAQAAFRDELVALARDSAEVSWREVRRGVDDLDSFTRPSGERARHAASRRPYRAKP
ncbi:MAG TPA: hypothetical protein VK778_07880 [Solirubrobacteraceae bacterium]|nr:hypothetical protein [Solirubrobacteraceae bacterium]